MERIALELADMLLDGTYECQQAAAYQLRTMGPRAEAAWPALVQTVMDPRDPLALLAAEALFALHPRNLFGAERLTVLLRRARDDRTRLRAARLLGRCGIGWSPAERVLRQLLGRPDVGEEVKRVANRALEDLGRAL